MNAAAVSPYLTTRETIDYLKLKSRSALQHLIVNHRLPYCRRGRCLLFDVREIDAWVHGHNSALEWSRAKRSA